jgi:transposase-like protein
LFSRQASSGVSVSEFCRREGINAGLFRRWRLALQGSSIERPEKARPEQAVAVPAPFIDLGDVRSAARFEVRLDLGSGVMLSIARG